MLLSTSGINATGSSLVLKMAGEQAWATHVVSHAQGSSVLTYGELPVLESEVGNNEAHGHYFLEGKLQLLDQETEWFFDRGARMLHVKTRGDQHPCNLRVQARVQV
jgi:hypothetical protein